ncbi:hypothetical protein RvY_09592 [Ramazzottius varieornatus]|uniref:Uncharacterized protein n=1 Tax=Ramazzottius varieornatus TaxID=947166 RepID=A0A1D1VCA8_RAMVA|nr:hypothetical protein RvY_09592 [Ramazzottius varieornatus]
MLTRFSVSRWTCMAISAFSLSGKVDRTDSSSRDCLFDHRFLPSMRFWNSTREAFMLLIILPTLPTMVAKMRTPTRKSMITKMYSTSLTGPGTSPMVIGNECWHESCLKCQICRTQLRESCYKRDGKMMCREDYQRLFGIKCSVCNQFVPSQELVMRVLGNIYHLRCFLCSVCGCPLQKGDQFIIRNGQLLCSMDFDHELMRLPNWMSGSLMSMDKLQSEENLLIPLTAADTSRRGPKRPRTILTSHQRRAFKTSFEVSPKPCRKVRESLAKDLGLSVRVVQVWFQNQRAKIKKLQRRQQQTGDKAVKSTGSKDATDAEEESSSDDSDDDTKTSEPTGKEDTVGSQKAQGTLATAEIDPQSNHGERSLDQEDFFGMDAAEMFAHSAALIENPYSLGSMTSLSPKSPTVDSSLDSSSFHDGSFKKRSVSGGRTSIKEKKKKVSLTNPIDNLYSMQSSYFGC